MQIRIRVQDGVLENPNCTKSYGVDGFISSTRSRVAFLLTCLASSCLALAAPSTPPTAHLASSTPPTVTLRVGPMYSNPDAPPDGALVLVNFWNGNTPVPRGTTERLLIYGPNQPKPIFGWEQPLLNPWIWNTRIAQGFMPGAYRVEALVNGVYTTAQANVRLEGVTPPRRVPSIGVRGPSPRRLEVRFSPARGAGSYLVQLMHNTDARMVGYVFTRDPSASFNLDADQNPDSSTDDLYVNVNALNVKSLLAPANDKLEAVADTITESLVFSAVWASGKVFKDVTWKE